MLRHLLIAAVLSCSYVAMSDQRRGRPTGLRSQLGRTNRFPRLESLLSLPVCLLPTEFLGAGILSEVATVCTIAIRPRCGFRCTTRQWHNFYPSNRRYHSGHHFMLDVF